LNRLNGWLSTIQCGLARTWQKGLAYEESQLFHYRRSEMWDLIVELLSTQKDMRKVYDK
jgi:hypothetical protein